MWFKVDDGLHASRKVIRIPRSIRLAAIGLWTISGSWSAHEELDGLVPGYMLDEWGATPDLIDALVDSGLWELVDNGREGIQFTNWEEYQPTRADNDARRESERTRKAEWRARKAQARAGNSSGPADVPAGHTRDWFGTDANVPSIPARPGPTRPDPSIPNGIEGGDDTSPALSTELSPTCAKHPQGTDKPCRACGTARIVYEARRAAERNKPTPTPRQDPTCSEHPGYPLPCDRCARDLAEHRAALEEATR